MRPLDVRGRTTVITGAASGMGAEVARELSRRGARLALVDRNAEGLAAVAATLAGAGHTTHVVDLSDDEAVAA
ncbi:MAG: SDR family NAD(P)-dependent oxidoreductase, partial [Microbacterium sp.]|nr:SDR family NAD(P)-dependent oxidoreductase [Microbacterium sp.]